MKYIFIILILLGCAEPTQEELSTCEQELRQQTTELSLIKQRGDMYHLWYLDYSNEFIKARSYCYRLCEIYPTTDEEIGACFRHCRGEEGL